MLEISKAFCLVGEPVRCERHGNGHINETFLLRTDEPHDYILQRLNTKVFPDIEGLMSNVAAVTTHLRRGCDDPRRVLTLGAGARWKILSSSGGRHILASV